MPIGHRITRPIKIENAAFQDGHYLAPPWKSACLLWQDVYTREHVLDYVKGSVQVCDTVRLHIVRSFVAHDPQAMQYLGAISRHHSLGYEAVDARFQIVPCSSAITTDCFHDRTYTDT